jgi:hypothetical protein
VRELTRICAAQTPLGRGGGKAGPVLNAVKALFFDGTYELAVREEGGRCVAVEGVKAKNIHIVCGVSDRVK